MVCGRCKTVVRAELEKLGIHYLTVDLGEVELVEKLTDTQKSELTHGLLSLYFELIDDKKKITIEKIKILIVDLVQNKNNGIKINLSDYLVGNLLQDYNSMSCLFSEVEHNTIEQYFILQKIEKVKELLMYDELNLSEIANQLNYSSVGYLSNQFKKVTGFTPTCFKQLKDKKRRQLEEL